MKYKQDILIAHTMKSGVISSTRKMTIRKHQCDVLLVNNHVDNEFIVHKNRAPLINKLPNICTVQDVLSIGRLFPRKKKKAFKKSILAEYGWMLNK